MREKYSLYNSLVLSSVALILIFIIDLFVPLGVAIGVLYVSCTVIILNESQKRIVLFSLAVSILILLVPILTDDINTSWMAYVNRGISIVSVWIVGFVAVRYKNLTMHRSKLEHDNKQLEEFAYILAHDLQGPLNTVINFSELLKEDYHDKIDERANKYLQYIVKGSTRMSSLIKGLLTYATIGKRMPRIPIVCKDVILDIMSDLTIKIKETKTEIELDDLPVVMGHKLEMRLLFQNLIMNAIKFSKKDVNPQIKILAVEENGFWKFSVKDNGIGIAHEHQDKIFEMLGRLNRKDEYEGAGIGLAHCQKIVYLHGGKIFFTSHLGKGSTFYFTIPS